MRYSTRDLTILAVFGTLWGIVEISLGAVLKSLELPLTGATLSGIGLTIAMTGRYFVPKRGATLFIGVIAMLLKLFSLGGVVLGPMIGIFSEALLAEIVLSLGAAPSLLLFTLAGILGTLWTMVQPFVTGLLLYGRDPFVVWLDMLDSGARMFGIDSQAVIWIVLGLAAVHVVIGAAAGTLAWSIGRQLRVRLGRETVQST